MHVTKAFPQCISYKRIYTCNILSNKTSCGWNNWVSWVSPCPADNLPFLSYDQALIMGEPRAIPCLSVVLPQVWSWAWVCAGVQILVFNKPCLNLREALGLNIPWEKREAQAARMKRNQHLRGLMGRASSKLMFAFLLRQLISGLKTTGLASSILSCFVLTQHTLIKCFLNAWSGQCVAGSRYTKLSSGRAGGRRQTGWKHVLLQWW